MEMDVPTTLSHEDGDSCECVVGQGVLSLENASNSNEVAPSLHPRAMLTSNVSSNSLTRNLSASEMSELDDAFENLFSPCTSSLSMDGLEEGAGQMLNG
jgi:hypothetical protein